MFGLMKNVPLVSVLQEVCRQGTQQCVPSFPVLGLGGECCSLKNAWGPLEPGQAEARVPSRHFKRLMEGACVRPGLVPLLLFTAHP